MDTLTHIVLGACIGEAVAGKQLGKKAMVLGAIAQSIPDFDFVASFWVSTTSDLLVHRGFTHSFLFTILVTPLLAWLSRYWLRSSGIGFGRWLLFWGLQIFIHQFIDAFNAYGTGWFVPFSNFRVSFNSLFVADPLFSIWPCLAAIILFVLRKNSTKRKLFVTFGLGLSVVYLLISIAFKLSVDRAAKDDLSAKHISFTRYFSTPTSFNNLLWYLVAETDSGYYIGYRSVLDGSKSNDFHFARRNDTLLKQYDSREDLKQLRQFSQGYYTAGMWHDTLVFNDLRFGEINGWAEPNPRFVFYYYLQYPDDNKMIVQRGRFAKWNKESIRAFLCRIKGN